MKKIAFIVSGHTGSTMPLIKNLILKGYFVDCYILCNNIIYDYEATDCNFIPSKRGIEEIPSNNWKELSSKYIKSDKFRIFSVSTFRPFENNRILNKIVGIARTWQIRKICNFINSQNYILINFVGRYQVSDIIQYGKYIKTKYIVSLHEVCDHSNPDFDHPNKVLKYLFSNKVPIILFSDKSTEDIKKYKGAVEENLYRVNFGQFDSFKIFQGEKHLDLPSHYVLFIGRFTPYKGLRLFYEATKELASKGYHFVVAGSGNDEAIEDLKRIPNFTIINRYLSNRDFVELVERSSFIVCPYTSMSQSGIPQTAFVFNKPIIATDLDGFKEIIQNGRNGLLFSSNNKLELSEYINLLIENNSYLNELIEGVGMFEKLFPKYSWKEITETYIKDFITCQEHYS